MLISYHLMYFFLKMTILNRFPICKQKIGMCKQANAIQKKKQQCKGRIFYSNANHGIILGAV